MRDDGDEVIDMGEEEEKEEREKEKEEGNKSVDGTGIQFLPGDIKGLNIKLNLLLAEFAARNQIVGILDELKRRKRISRKDYMDINSFLAKTL